MKLDEISGADGDALVDRGDAAGNRLGGDAPAAWVELVAANNDIGDVRRERRTLQIDPGAMLICRSPISGRAHEEGVCSLMTSPVLPSTVTKRKRSGSSSSSFQ